MRSDAVPVCALTQHAVVRPSSTRATLMPLEAAVAMRDRSDVDESSASMSPMLEEVPSPSDDKSTDEVAEIDAGERTISLGVYRVQLSNTAQRFLSAMVLAPLITYFLWRSPAFATTTVCAVVVSVSNYEFAWLAHRIHTRIVTTVERYEDAGPTAGDERPSSCSSTGRLSAQSNGPTHPSDQDMSVEDETIQESKIASLGRRCAVSPIAERYYRSQEWQVAIGVSLLGTAVSSTAFALLTSKSTFDSLEFGGFRMYYSVISSFAAWVCACFSPDWQSAALLLVQKEIFTALTVYSMKCPINDFHCNDFVHPAMLLVGGVLVITLFRICTARSRLALLVHLMLDVLGFLYIIGSLFFIVSFVDLDRKATYRKLIIALLYVVWAADSGAYFVGQIFESCHYRNAHPLASHLSARKDYEGTFIAVFFGVGAMFVSSDLLEIEGSVSEKFFFAAVAVVVGRIGDLFESLLKRAALVKDSGTLIPGHGGVLDRIDALMFASIVFSRYFGAIYQSDQ